MSYTQDFSRCLKFIDDHLSEKLTVEDVASEMGYSLYHFCRMFKSIHGVSAGTWIRQSKLERASEALLSGSSVTDAAISCGFDSVSGFNKAFRRQYGMNPTECIQKGGFIISPPEIKIMESFSAVGYHLAPPEGNFDVLESRAYWIGKDFSYVSAEDYNKLTYPGYADIGVWIHSDSIYYFFGPIVKSKDYIPFGMVAIDIPSAEYAVFKVPASATIEILNENIRRTWKYIFGEWFDSSEYKFDENKVDFEYYCGDESYIYVPIVKK